MTAPAGGRVAARRPWARRSAVRSVAALLAGVAVALVAAGCGSGSGLPEGVSAFDDLADTMDCTVEEGLLQAEGAVTNPTEDRVDYRLVLVWETAGFPEGQATALLEDVGPGVRRAFEVTAPGSGDTRTTCRVDRVERVAR